MKLRWLVLLWMGLFAGANCLAEVPTTGSFAKYQSILTRSPFKKLENVATAATQSSVGNLTLTGFFFEDKLKKVWLRDEKTKKTYYVAEGETIPDSEFHVDKIDPDNQTVVLSHGLESQTLAFPAKAPVPQPVPVAVARPAYRGPYRNAPFAPPAEAPAAVPADVSVPPNAAVPGAYTPGKSPQPASPATPASPTSLRRRIMRQNIHPVAEPGESGQPAEPNNGEGNQPAEEAPAQ